MRCTRHNVSHCGRSAACIDERRNQQVRDARRSAAASDPLADPTSPTHAAVYGGAFYGTIGAGHVAASPADCAPSTSSDTSSSTSYSSDSGSSSCGSD